jgi:unsaturated rhamnogalacturonyl hydrolase
MKELRRVVPGSECRLLLPVLILTTMLSSGLAYAQDTSRYSVKMAESIMKWKPSGYGSWDYVTGTVLRGFEELWRVTKDQRYYNYLKKTVDNVVNNDGSINGYRLEDYNLDEIKEGCQLLLLYKETGEDKYRIAADQLRLQLEGHPRTNSGGFWHKKVYPWQMWLDGLYMGSPFYAEYSSLFGFTGDLDDVVHQITEVAYHTYDPDAKLFYHGWDESGFQSWADPVTGASPSFWGRAIGWYAMAIVDVLDYLPQDHAGRDTVLAIFNRMAEGLALYQDPGEHVWWQVTDQVGRDSNYLESSSSCMFVYALAKGVRLGYLDASYRDVAVSGYQGILDNFIDPNPNGTINLTSTCLTAGLGNGRDGTYKYYTMQTSVVSNDGKAMGPFILASIEMEMMDSVYPPGNLLLDTLLFKGPILSWFDNSDRETGFILERMEHPSDPLKGQGAEQGNFIPVADLPAGTISWTDTTIESITTYSYRVQAYNDTLSSVYSNTVTLTTYFTSGQPLPAGNPVPGDGSVMISPDQILSWESGLFASSHDVYFGTEDPPPFTGNFQDDSFSPADMERGVTYYWRIDEVNGNGTTGGSIWSFTTDSTPALSSPQDLVADAPALEIRPNPADRYIRFNLPEGTGKPQIRIYDSSGRLIDRVRSYNTGNSEDQVTINTEDLPAGIYYLNLNVSGKNSSPANPSLKYYAKFVIAR